MTTLNEDQANVPAEPETTDELGSGETDFGSGGLHSESTADDGPAAHTSEHSNSKVASALHKLRKLERRAIDLPIVGKFHAPDKHDVVYVAGMAALLAFGAVELPIAFIVLGGHVLVKQHQSRSLSAIGEVMEDVWGHHV
ncbi:hypothetical protein [Mycobacterium sp.]|uniref:hypothetical protein n=1 Tax=Mycobacterium sp. TaxID=1785 RepID=UPI003C73BB4D